MKKRFSVEKFMYLKAKHELLHGCKDGVKTYLSEVDSRMSRPLRAGDVCLVASRPAVGKTSFAFSMAWKVAQVTGVPVLIFGAEGSAEYTAESVMRSMLDMPRDLFNSGKWRLHAAVPQIYIVDDASSPQDIAKHVTAMKKKTGLSMVIVDYIQFIEGLDIKFMKRLSEDAGAPFVVTSHVHRSLEKRRNKRPQMKDIIKAGVDAKEASFVLSLYRKKLPHHNEHDIEVSVFEPSKKRHGDTAKVKLNAASGLFYEDEQARFQGA